MASLSRDNPLCTALPSERNPTILYEVIEDDILDFPNKDTNQLEESLKLIGQLLTPIVSKLAPKPKPLPPSGGHGLKHAPRMFQQRQVVARELEELFHIEYPANETAGNNLSGRQLKMVKPSW